MNICVLSTSTERDSERVRDREWERVGERDIVKSMWVTTLSPLKPRFAILSYDY